jgi:adenine-specific DNA-methyltransferase
MHKEHELLRQIKYPRNTDLDPQIVWRGKDEQDWSDLATKVQAQLNSMITAAS